MKHPEEIVFEGQRWAYVSGKRERQRTTNKQRIVLVYELLEGGEPAEGPSAPMATKKRAAGTFAEIQEAMKEAHDFAEGKADAVVRRVAVPSPESMRSFRAWGDQFLEARHPEFGLVAINVTKTGVIASLEELAHRMRDAVREGLYSSSSSSASSASSSSSLK